MKMTTVESRNREREGEDEVWTRSCILSISPKWKPRPSFKFVEHRWTSIHSEGKVVKFFFFFLVFGFFFSQRKKKI